MCASVSTPTPPHPNPAGPLVGCICTLHKYIYFWVIFTFNAYQQISVLSTPPTLPRCACRRPYWFILKMIKRKSRGICNTVLCKEYMEYTGCLVCRCTSRCPIYRVSCKEHRFSSEPPPCCMLASLSLSIFLSIHLNFYFSKIFELFLPHWVGGCFQLNWIELSKRPEVHELLLNRYKLSVCLVLT